VALIFSSSEIKIQIDYADNVISPAIQYGEIVDVYITCKHSNFEVLDIGHKKILFIGKKYISWDNPISPFEYNR